MNYLNIITKIYNMYRIHIMNNKTFIKINKNLFATFSLPSNTSKKKYRVELYNKNGNKLKTLQFGQKGFNHYEDKTPLKAYSYLDHKDPKRKINYRKRHSKILKKDGKPAYQDPLQPSFYSFHFLWT